MTTSGEEDKVPSSSIAIGAVVDEKDEERHHKHRSRTSHRDKEDREAKRRARESRNEVGSFHASEDPSKRKARSSSRRDREDAKAKEKASRSTSGSRSPTRYKTEDAKAKARSSAARSTSRSISGSRSPNKYKTDEDTKAKARSSAARSTSRSISGSRSPTRNRRDSRKSKTSKSPPRSTLPGAVSVDEHNSDRLTSSRRSRKESEKSKTSGTARRSTTDRVRRERTKAAASNSSTRSADNQEAAALPVAERKSEEPDVELIAQAVENDDDVENVKFRRLENENEELRREMQEILDRSNRQTNTAETNNDGTLEELPRKSHRLRYICACLVVVAIVAGVVIFLMMRPKAQSSQSTTEIVPDEETPSSSPSLAVTIGPTFSELTIQDCLAISEGRPVHNQESLSKRQFDLRFQVSLVEESDLGVIEKEALKEKMQQGPLLTMAGCDPVTITTAFRGNRRMAVIDTNVGDAKVAVGNVAGPCANNEASSCFEIDVKLLLFLEAYETDTSLIQLSVFVFGQEEFAMNAGMPFSRIELVSAEPHDLTTTNPSASPSATPTATQSLNPTRVPGGDPTISPSVSPSVVPSQAPSLTPSSSPSAGPTFAPSKSPTRVPVADPTESPTVSTRSPSTSPSNSPSKSPTKTPTSNSPTSLPSAFPSLPPSSFPSVSPSIAPSTAPSEIPSKAPSVSPSEAPSPAPSITPGRCGPLVGGTQCSCDDEFYHCSALGYCGYGADEDAFYVEGEPRQYDCPSAPVSLITSSAVVTQSSTRTASNGQVMGAWRAIDGNTDSHNYFTCTQTYFNKFAWWQVDFGFSAEVHKITIWNIDAGNNGNWQRMEGSKLLLLDSDGGTLSTLDISLGATREPLSETFNISPPLANVASAKITNTNGLPLQICEVQAYGYIQ